MCMPNAMDADTINTVFDLITAPALITEVNLNK